MISRGMMNRQLYEVGTVPPKIKRLALALNITEEEAGKIMSSLENPEITDDVMTSEDKEVMERLMLKQQGPDYQYNEENLYEGSRDMRSGGGIMSITPRQEYGLGSIVKSIGKAVKGVAKGVKNVVSSDIGKAALLAAGGYYLGGGQIPGLSKFLPAMKYGNAAGTGFGIGNILPNIANIAGFTGTAEKLATMGTLGKGAAILGGTALMTSLFGSPQQAQQLYQQNPGAVKNYLGQYYRNVNPKKEGQSDEEYEQEVSSFINQNIAEYDVSQSSTFAEGGRVSLAEGGLGNINPFAVYQSYLNEIQDAQANQQYNSLYNPTVSFQTSDGDSETQTVTSNPVASAFNPTMMDMATLAFNPALGIANLASRRSTGLSLAQRAMDTFGISRGPFGRTAGFGVDSMAGMASGPTHGVDAVNEGSVGADASAGGAAGAAAASAAGSNDGPGGGTFAYGGRVMRELGGIMNVPMGEPRMNQGGVPELDYRQEGGFVPVGIKEKADDVPAMLSKNEFVMTADAVRGMGNGNIETGAQKMYNLMKSMENRIA